jgi:LCP family protein required for cell wall assembly
VTRAIDAVSQNTRISYLVVGFDNAAENTDVICTVSYSEHDNAIRILQIPRDTYFDSGHSQSKINQIFSSKRASGMDKNNALRYLADTISSALGVHFDGYVGISIEAFRNVIDAIGGVDVDLPRDIDISDENYSDITVLKKGINHLDGALAERFVRYRRGYVMGDLSRIDAQKIFINAIISKVKKEMDLSKIIELGTIYRKDVISDIRLSSGIEIISAFLKNQSASVFYATMPGEPAVSQNGLSFYVLNRKSSAEIVKRYLFAENEFDPQRRFMRLDDIGFINIYNDEKFRAQEFCDDDLSSIKIK